jgi:hypothetical protein
MLKWRRLDSIHWSIDRKASTRNMSKEELPIYLNDHLAGSVGALELLDRLIKTYKGKPLERFFHDLRNEIEADQDTSRI